MKSEKFCRSLKITTPNVLILYHQLALALDALKFRQMAAKKRTRRLDKSVKRTAKTAGSDGRERAQLYG